MQEQVNIMVDLETMGTSPTAAICAIGAVKFDSNKITASFSTTVDMQSCIDIGMTIEASTIYWWLQQGKEAREAICDRQENIKEALKRFYIWSTTDEEGELHDQKILLWGNGAAFDNVILAEAYRLAGMEQPWSYWNDSCYRTLKNLLPHIINVYDTNKTKHIAVNDAEIQAEHAIKLLKVFNR